MTDWTPVCGPRAKIIPRSEAIQRMARGEKCETFCAGLGEHGAWDETQWGDFDESEARQFRIPPEPRRAAREWRSADGIHANEGYQRISPPIHVREVLPDEVVVRKMTRDEAMGRFGRLALSWDVDAMALVSVVRALGLLKEDKS